MVEAKQKPSDEDLFTACHNVFHSENKPLEIWRVAQAAELSESEVITALIRAAVNGRSVTFRYPPLPTAAITGICQNKTTH